MKKPSIGLVIEGNSTASTVLRFPAVIGELGPIKSSGLQVARRVSNFLKGGYGVNSYTDLADARFILIRVADSSVERVVSELCSLDLDWPQHGFVLCETWLPTQKLDPLRTRGSGTASLVALPTAHEKTFAVEGDTSLVRSMRRLLDRAQVNSLEVRGGSKHLLFAATLLCSAVPVHHLLLSQQLLRESGISGKQLSAVIESMSLEMLTGFVKGARTPWGGALAENLKVTKGNHWDELDASHPDLADILRDQLELNRARMKPRLSRGQGA